MSKNTTTTNNSTYSQNNNNNQDFKESINRSLDETKHNINRSIDESKNQIPRYNTIVNSYQEQSLQAAKEISEEYIESQKAIINSIQSAWKPYSESYNGMVNSFSSPDSIVKAYSRIVSNVADNAVSALRVTNNMIFSNLDSWKSVLEQAKDNSKQIFHQNVNTAKTFEQNSREIHTAAKDTISNSNTETTISNNTTASQQQSNKKI
jgi:prophage DNA circulation protein